MGPPSPSPFSLGKSTMPGTYSCNLETQIALKLLYNILNVNKLENNFSY